MTHMIILAGAPKSTKLDWNEKTLDPSPRIEDSSINLSTSNQSSEKAFTAQWRQIAFEKLQMRPVLPKLDIKSPGKDGIDTVNAEFFSPADFVSQESPSSDVSGDVSQPSGGSGDSTSEALSEFYDHSFSIHEAIPSSQLSEYSDITPGTPTYDSHEELSMQPANTGGGGIIRSPSQRRLSQAPKPRRLSDLAQVPNASYLRSIEPQTMTVNLVVAILSMSPPRTVTTGARYGKPQQTELVELQVGDDTKSGFTITLWLPREMHVNWKDGARSAPEGARSALRRNLRTLRPRDVIMLQNVALSSFRDKVHGQSLKGDVTKVDLLFRKKTHDDDMVGIYSVSALRNASEKDPQVLKVKKVRDWMVECVGESNEPGAAPRGRKRSQR